jgi:hypothetical protein
MKGETSEPEKPHESTRGVRRRTTVTEQAHVLHGIAELLSRYREEVAQL